MKASTAIGFFSLCVALIGLAVVFGPSAHSEPVRKAVPERFKLIASEAHGETAMNVYEDVETKRTYLVIVAGAYRATSVTLMP